MEYFTDSYMETEQLGERLGRGLNGGEIVALSGDLGAGKTAFVRGLARGLDVTDSVKSPTFTIVDEHEGRVPLFHFDMYRLGGFDELFDIGWDDYVARGGVCAVEWSENVPEIIDPETITVDIRNMGGDRRCITIGGVKEL